MFDGQTLYSTLLTIHIATGGIALVVAPGAMPTSKGGLWHRRWGKVYFWSMAVVAVTAVVMSMLKPNLFLLFVALFSFQAAFAGYRVLGRKRPDRGQRAGWLDWGVTGGAVLAGVGLVVYAVSVVTASDASTGLSGGDQRVVAGAFGLIALAIGGREAHSYLRPSTDKNAWWFAHLQGMLIAYIATVSAFSAVNFGFLPPMLRWLWPTLVGAPLIAVWTIYYRRKFAKPRAAAIATTSPSVGTTT